MLAAIMAGVVYFAVVFAIGTGLGVLRTGGLVPRIGPTAAVLLEIPIILAASWLVCRHLIARFSVPPAMAPRLLMGAVALMLLLLAELGLSMTLLRRTLGQHLTAYLSPAQALGLLAQIVFAAMPAYAAYCNRKRNHLR